MVTLLLKLAVPLTDKLPDIDKLFVLGLIVTPLAYLAV